MWVAKQLLQTATPQGKHSYVVTFIPSQHWHSFSSARRCPALVSRLGISCITCPDPVIAVLVGRPSDEDPSDVDKPMGWAGTPVCETEQKSSSRIVRDGIVIRQNVKIATKLKYW